MKFIAFASRNSKEILRDPLNLAFGLGFPLIILCLMQAIQANIPVNIYDIKSLIPGITVFGLSFIALFASILISKDRSTSFLMRLFAAPISASDFLLGYILPLLPMAIVQTIICFIAAAFFGLPMNINAVIALVTFIPCEIFFIGVGLLAGSLLNDKQVGGICGALLTNLTAWMSGAWFDLSLVGGVFKRIAYALPFAHAVDAGRAAIDGNYADIFPHLVWVIGYAVLVMVLAVIAFRGKMNSDKI
jgi:ABC-2 type transport system permease protein